MFVWWETVCNYYQKERCKDTFKLSVFKAASRAFAWLKALHHFHCELYFQCKWRLFPNLLTQGLSADSLVTSIAPTEHFTESEGSWGRGGMPTCVVVYLSVCRPGLLFGFNLQNIQGATIHICETGHFKLLRRKIAMEGRGKWLQIERTIVPVDQQ